MRVKAGFFIALVSLTYFFWIFPCSAAVHWVPDHYSDIEEAVSMSSDGDMIVLRPGTYTGAGNTEIYCTKGITIRSQEGPTSCVIDCGGNGYAFDFQHSGAVKVVLAGLTIRNGYTTSMGGAVRTTNLLVCTDCFFLNNETTAAGGAVLIWGYGSAEIKSCYFSGNACHGPTYGGGAIRVELSAGTVEIINSIFHQNIKTGGPGSGAALDVWNGSSTTVTNCTFYDNYADYDGSAIRGDPVVINSILWDNQPSEILGNPTVTYSDVFGGYPGTGNIDEDPLFVYGSKAYNGFYLSHIDAGQTQDSPCIDAGYDASAGVCFINCNAPVCLDEMTTSTDGDYDINQMDMGAHYPFGCDPLQPPTPTATASPTSPPTPSPSPTPIITPAIPAMGRTAAALTIFVFILLLLKAKNFQRGFKISGLIRWG